MKNKYLRGFWYSLSSKQRYLVRRLYYFPTDLLDRIRGTRHKYVPSRGAIYTGSPSGSKRFIAQSHHQLNLLINKIKLRPKDTILDIGSGIGRTAISLTKYLDSDGNYEGFDVVKSGVDWCKSRIQKDFKNFNFLYIPLYNDLYNNSKLKAENFVFPYKNNSFDKVFSFSVFTHMQIHEIQNYLNQINRVLRKDGMAFSTFFLFDDNNEKFISSNDEFHFPIKKEGYRLMNNNVAYGNIAINVEKLKQMMHDSNLTIVNIYDGFWKGNNGAEEYQDIVVFKKKTLQK